MILSFEETGELLDTLAERFPKELFAGLNGGVSLQPRKKTNPECPTLGLLVMGEYCTGQLGKYINLYYGSFKLRGQMEDWTQAQWEHKLYATLSHELTHHMEGRAGTNDLDRQDQVELAQYRRKWKGQE